MTTNRLATAGLLAVATTCACLPACSHTETTAPTPGCPQVQAATSYAALADVPGDSAVTALLHWTGGSPLSNDSLSSFGLLVIYRFHYQPAVLVRGTGSQLRQVVAADPSAQVSFGVALRPLGCPADTPN